jgi:hypothetical protein
LRRKQQPPFVQDGGRTGIRRADKAGLGCRYRKRQLKAELHKTKNFGCPLQFEMCRKIKNFKGLSAGAVADVRAYPRLRSFPSFLCSVNFQDGILFFTSFLMLLKKSVGSLVSADVGCVQSFSPRSPLQGFFFSGTREANASAQYGPSFSILSHLSPILVIFIVCDLSVVTNLSQHDGSSVGLVWLERRHSEWYLRWQYYHQ